MLPTPPLVTTTRVGRAARRAVPGCGGPLVALLLAVAAWLPGCGAPPPHLVLIVVDTLRRDHVSPYDAEARTPHIAALAERGTAVEAFSSFHQTTMSMGALFTGRTPSIASGSAEHALHWSPSTWCGMGRFQERPPSESCLPGTIRTLGEAMRSRGYTTVGVVANALLFRPAGFARGFDRWVEVGESGAAQARTWPHVNAEVRRVLPQRPEGPIFLYVHYLDAHDHHFLGLEYAEAVAQADAGVGDLLGLLEERGVLENAVVVLTSDHGEHLGGRHVVPALPGHAGNPSYRAVLEVPLIVAGAEVPELPPMVRSEDVHRLLLELVGERRTPASDLSPEELFVTERYYRTYQRGRFKSFWNRDGDVVLVDLEADPGETDDVAAAHPDVVAAHGARVDALTDALATRDLEPDQTADAWRERLRALGYLE